MFSTYSQSTQYTDSFDTNFLSFDEDDADMADPSLRFYGGSATPTNPLPMQICVARLFPRVMMVMIISIQWSSL